MKYYCYKLFLTKAIIILIIVSSNTLELLLLPFSIQFASANLIIQSSKSFSQELKQQEQDKLFNNKYDNSYPWNRFNSTQKLCQDGTFDCNVIRQVNRTTGIISKPTKRVIIGVLESIRHSNRKDHTWTNPYKDCDGITASLCAIKAKGHYYSWITQRENRIKKNEKLLTKIGR